MDRREDAGEFYPGGRAVATLPVATEAAIGARVDALDAQVRALDAQVRETDAQVRETDAQVREIDAQVRALDAQGRETDAQVRALDAQVRALDAQVRAIPDPRYAVGAVQTGATIALADRAVNLAKPTADALTLAFPDEIDGKARDFLLALYPDRSTAPSISYGSYLTLVGDSDSLAPTARKWNIYSFTEISRSKFLVALKVADTLVEHAPASIDQLLDAMAASGMDVSAIENPGDLAAALGLTDDATLEDCVEKFLYG